LSSLIYPAERTGAGHMHFEQVYLALLKNTLDRRWRLLRRHIGGWMLKFRVIPVTDNFTSLYTKYTLL